MKTRAKYILTVTAYALTLLAAQNISAATAPAHVPAASHTQENDTIVYTTAKSLLESINELSRTSSKLSETAIKLLESQEGISLQSPVKTTNTDTVYIMVPATKPEGAYRSDGAYLNTDSISYELVGTQGPYVRMPVDTMERVGGKYVWIPDVNAAAVDALLNGDSLSLNDPRIDLSEMTLWRGDSIPMALPTKRLGRYDRKLYNWLIYPKGLWHIGLTANYGELNTEDMEILSIVNDIDLHGKIYSVKPSVSYFLRNNLCVGLRLAFTKGDMAVNSFKVDIDEDMSFNLHDIKYSSDSYSAAVFLQQYFGLSRRGRFAVFNEAEVSVGTGSSHFIRPFDGQLRDTRTKTQSFNINYSPGVSIMMMKNAAFNLSFGIFGFHLKNEKQWENGEESGSRFTSGINFRFNIFNINFGVSIII